MPPTTELGDLDADAFDWSVLGTYLQEIPFGQFTALNGALARLSADTSQPEHVQRVAWVLGSICFLHCEPGDRLSPFRPAIQLEGQRSFSIDDLTTPTLSYLHAIAQRIARPDLKGRVCDILWLRRRNLGVGNALEAIDAYRSLSLDGTSSVAGHYIVECWDRAMCLGRMLRGSAEDSLTELEDLISQALGARLAAMDSLTFDLSSLARRYGIDRDNAHEQACVFREVSRQAGGEGKFLLERSLLTEARQWERYVARDDFYWAISTDLAASFEKEADAIEQSETASYVRVASLLEKAIQVHREIPRRFRNRRFDANMRELRQRHVSASARAMEEFSPYESEPIYLAESAANAEARVKGKPIMEALLALITLFPIPGSEAFNRAAPERGEGSVVDFLGTTIMSTDGLTVARIPSALSGRDDELARARAIQDYVRGIELLVKGRIVPALEVFSREHHVQARELDHLIRESPAVPPGHEVFWIKGLAAGFNWDFLTSAHILVPQVEAFLRYLLKERGIDTTTRDPEGIQSEAALGTLLDMDETADILGDNLRFTLDAVLLDRLGPNFRNYQAHGLLKEGSAAGYAAVYIWWLCLYLVVFPFWAGSRAQQAGGQESQ